MTAHGADEIDGGHVTFPALSLSDIHLVRVDMAEPVGAESNTVRQT